MRTLLTRLEATSKDPAKELVLLKRAAKKVEKLVEPLSKHHADGVLVRQEIDKLRVRAAKRGVDPKLAKKIIDPLSARVEVAAKAGEKVMHADWKRTKDKSHREWQARWPGRKS